MNLKEYCKEIAKEHNERSRTALREFTIACNQKTEMEDAAGYECDLWNRCDLFLDVGICYEELSIEFESPHRAALDWLLECEPVSRPYFEICGPKMKKEAAQKLAKEYNLQNVQEGYPERVCTLSSFGNQGAQTTNYGLFHLDGRIGLNGTFDRIDNNGYPASQHCNLLLSLIYLVDREPELEFAMMVTKWDEVPDRFWNAEDEQLPCTWEFAPQPEDVSYGVAYDPKTRCIRVLEPESAWNAVKKYQEQYTEEERRVFDPVQSREYYEKNPEGRRQLTAFLNRPVQKCVSGEISLQGYIENMIAEHWKTHMPVMPFCLTAWKELYRDLELKILCDDSLMVTKGWLTSFHNNDRRPVPGERRYLELCGPKITKQQAMKMAADYNEPSVRYMIGEMCCYDEADGSGAFHLDGCVGASGIPLRKNDMDKIMESALDTISAYPDFEFMLLVFLGGPKLQYENGIAVYDRQDVQCGIQYDPVRKLLTILKARSAYSRMKQYQAQYSLEERRLFEKEVCRRYYAENSKGKAELAEFAEYQQNVFHKKM